MSREPTHEQKTRPLAGWVGLISCLVFSLQVARTNPIAGFLIDLGGKTLFAALHRKSKDATEEPEGP